MTRIVNTSFHCPLSGPDELLNWKRIEKCLANYGRKRRLRKWRRPRDWKISKPSEAEGLKDPSGEEGQEATEVEDVATKVAKTTIEIGQTTIIKTVLEGHLTGVEAEAEAEAVAATMARPEVPTKAKIETSVTNTTPTKIMRINSQITDPTPEGQQEDVVNL